MSTIMNPLILLTVGVFICAVSITVQVTASNYYSTHNVIPYRIQSRLQI